jgi:hypothetical protein
VRAGAALVLTWLAALSGSAACSLVGLGGLTGGTAGEDASVEAAADGAADAPASGDASLDVAADTQATGDSGSPPEASDPGILCHPARCDPASEYCCFRYLSGTGYVYACTADDGGTCVKSLKVRCTSALDCAAQGASGDVCCAVYDDAGDTLSVDCEDPAVCASYPVHAIYCDPSAPVCDAGQSCVPDPDTQGFFFCQ